MKLREIAERLKLRAVDPAISLNVTVRGGYTGDLLSDVLAHGRENDLWITLQVHPNIVAVAGIRGIAGIVLTNGRNPEGETVERAAREGIPILVSEMSAFELSARLYMLIDGDREERC